MRIVVLGGTGALGRVVCDRLSSAGHVAVSASRSTGVDVTTGAGLAATFADADAVIDCLNVATLSARRAVSFFGAAGDNVGEALREAGTPHLVTVSIVNVTDPRLRRMGYYRGKAVQEAASRKAEVPWTIVRSAQWFELTEQLRTQIRVGRTSFVPRMRARPLGLRAAAEFVVTTALDAPRNGIIEVAGPDEFDMADLAGRVAAVDEPDSRCIPFTAPGLRAMARGALLPHDDATITGPTFDAWLALRAGGR